MAIRHVVTFRWSSDAPADQSELVSAALAELPGAIPEIKAYRFGPDEGLVDGNMDYAVVADFDNADDFLVYRSHPDHVRFIAEHITGKVADRSAVQFHLRA
jgi:hypothetical protein